MRHGSCVISEHRDLPAGCAAPWRHLFYAIGVPWQTLHRSDFAPHSPSRPRARNTALRLAVARERRHLCQRQVYHFQDAYDLVDNGANGRALHA